MKRANQARGAIIAAATSAFMLTATSASANVYRCPDASGRIVIQQMPCTGGTKLDVRPATGGDDAAHARNAERGGSAGVSNQDVLSAIAQGRPTVGMTEATLKMVMGAPSKVNRDNYGGRASDQVIYQRPDGTWYVYVSDGMVTSTQFRNYPNRPTSRAACPNSLAIRNMETSANSVTISRERKRELQRQVAQAKACR